MREGEMGDRPDVLPVAFEPLRSANSDSRIFCAAGVFVDTPAFDAPDEPAPDVLTSFDCDGERVDDLDAAAADEACATFDDPELLIIYSLAYLFLLFLFTSIFKHQSIYRKKANLKNTTFINFFKQKVRRLCPLF